MCLDLDIFVLNIVSLYISSNLKCLISDVCEEMLKKEDVCWFVLRIGLKL